MGSAPLTSPIMQLSLHPTLAWTTRLCVPAPQGAGRFEHSLTLAHVQYGARGQEKGFLWLLV